MQVELLVNLKIGSGKVIRSGTVFSDTKGPIPEFVMRRLRRKQARIVPEHKPTVGRRKEASKPSAGTPVKETKVEVSIEGISADVGALVDTMAGVGAETSEVKPVIPKKSASKSKANSGSVAKGKAKTTVKGGNESLNGSRKRVLGTKKILKTDKGGVAWQRV